MRDEKQWARIEKRDELWPDAPVVVSNATCGVSRTPRVVPLVAALVDSLSDAKERAGRLYVALWAHEEDGLVEVNDPEQIAFEAGYWTNRASRTFAERVTQLEGMGFVRQQGDGIRACGFILMLDPLSVVRRIVTSDPGRVPPRWLKVLDRRCRELGVRA